jgi:hypothetical protein
MGGPDGMVLAAILWSARAPGGFAFGRRTRNLVWSDHSKCLRRGCLPQKSGSELAYGPLFGAKNRAILFSQHPCACLLAHLHFLVIPNSLFDSFDKFPGADSDPPPSISLVVQEVKPSAKPLCSPWLQRLTSSRPTTSPSPTPKSALELVPRAGQWLAPRLWRNMFRIQQPHVRKPCNVSGLSRKSFGKE